VQIVTCSAAQLVRISYILLIGFCSSCSGQNAFTEQPQETYTENGEDSVLLKYTSGIRAILEDNKGDTWFGSHNEGVCLFDGKRSRISPPKMV
jgi:ligand-binding sensor domain-containing protein